jgi:hypothetical protein
VAPLPYNNTDIYILTYFNGFRDHQVSVRFDSVQITPQQVADNVGNFFQFAAPALPNDAGYVSARVLTQGLSFTLPAPVPTTMFTGGIVAKDAGFQALQTTIPGRSQQGRRNTVSLIGLHIPPPVSWVYTGNTNNILDNLITFLQGTNLPSATTGAWIAIDGTDTTWYNRVTFDYNDYWIRQLRR